MDIQETIIKIKEEMSDHPELDNENIEKYIEAFLKEKNVIREISCFISYCIVNKKEI